MADYNGWSNRATWNVALWAGNDEPRYRAQQAYTPRGTWTAEKARAFCVECFGDTTPDGCKLSGVDFAEIATAWNDE